MIEGLKSLILRFWGTLRRPSTVIAGVGAAGFAIDMLVKPISNAGLILLLVMAAPWILKSVKRLKVGEYLEFENLTLSEADRRLEREAAELLQDTAESPNVGRAPQEQLPAPNAPFDSADLGEPVQVKKGAQGFWMIRTTVKKIAKLERLVVNWLEAELGVQVLRRIRVGHIELDGVAMTKPVPTLIEIKIIETESSLEVRLQGALTVLQKAQEQWVRRNGDLPHLLIVAAISEELGDPEQGSLKEAARTFKSAIGRTADIRLVSLSELGEATAEL